MLIRIKVDQLIVAGLNNYKILASLDSDKEIPQSLIPNNNQLTDRRHYLTRTALRELNNNTKSGFYAWLEKNKKKPEEITDHDFLILYHLLCEDNFILIFSTKSLLHNAKKQAESTQHSFLAMDATHKLVSCGFLFTTFATSTLNQEIADVAYMLHYKENTETYSYGLLNIQTALSKHFDFEWKPKVIFLIRSDSFV